MTTGHRDLGESETEEGQNNIIDEVQTVPEKKLAAIFSSELVPHFDNDRPQNFEISHRL
jgi:hypothetical protein